MSLGLFASLAVNPTGSNGLFLGDATFFGKEVAAVTMSSAYAFAFTYAMLWIINRVTPVRTTKAEEEGGLDESLHGESAYLT